MLGKDGFFIGIFQGVNLIEIYPMLFKSQRLAHKELAALKKMYPSEYETRYEIRLMREFIQDFKRNKWDERLLYADY